MGLVGWAYANLFSSWQNSLLTFVAGATLVLGLFFGLWWVFLRADWTIISRIGGFFFIGQYNTDQACPGNDCFWRPQASLLMVTALLGMAWAVAGGGVLKRIALAVAIARRRPRVPPLRHGADGAGRAASAHRQRAGPGRGVGAGPSTRRLGTGRNVAVLGVLIFLLTLVLLRGIEGVPGLQPVQVTDWGGLMLNLLLAISGITVSLPIGIALALGRRSNLPVVKVLCVVFIEILRGVPLITLLFMSQVLVPLAFPEDFPLNSVLRAAIVITLFSSAYMAENIRGGLQALHPGQAEAARALGLPSWQTTLLISLPQAIRNVIPAIVGQFISLFKDTSLVYIIGMLDVVEFSRAFIQGNPEYLANAKEVFIVLALIFWVFCYGMSYVSRQVEKDMGVGRR